MGHGKEFLDKLFIMIGIKLVRILCKIILIYKVKESLLLIISNNYYKDKEAPINLEQTLSSNNNYYKNHIVKVISTITIITTPNLILANSTSINNNKTIIHSYQNSPLSNNFKDSHNNKDHHLNSLTITNLLMPISSNIFNLFILEFLSPNKYPYKLNIS